MNYDDTYHHRYLGGIDDYTKRRTAFCTTYEPQRICVDCWRVPINKDSHFIYFSEISNLYVVVAARRLLDFRRNHIMF